MKRILIGSLLIFLACGDPTAPEDLLEEDRYIRVFSELVVVNQLTEDQLGGVSRDYLRDQVFEKHDIDPDRFNRTHQYYQKQPELQLERIDQVEEILKEERDRFQDRLNEERSQAREQPQQPDSVSSQPHDSLSPQSQFNNPPD
ncbi:MAG: DUF4296 domain-containing protein [Balneolaceae bacterium]